MTLGNIEYRCYPFVTQTFFSFHKGIPNEGIYSATPYPFVIVAIIVHAFHTLQQLLALYSFLHLSKSIQDKFSLANGVFHNCPTDIHQSKPHVGGTEIMIKWHSSMCPVNVKQHPELSVCRQCNVHFLHLLLSLLCYFNDISLSH